MRDLPPVLGFAAFSGTGKTTLLMRLIPRLRQQGLRLGLVKRTHHHFEIDRPGKDSDLLYRAGAQDIVVGSRERVLLLSTQPQEPPFDWLLRRVATPKIDLILVEGFKRHPFPKIELHRPGLGHPLLCRNDPHIIALAVDAPLPDPPAVPLLDLNDDPVIASFVLAWYAQADAAAGRAALVTA
jgi:molybdopterin-guanine dinucleotide biosynthesis protein B